MKKPNVTNFVKTARAFATKHSPEILTGIGVGGMFTTIGLAVGATPKALKLIEAEKERQNQELIDEAKKAGHNVYDQITKLSYLEVVKVTWKVYIPAIVTGTASTLCIIGASSVSARRNAALATAYQLSTTALSDYKEKVIETIGEKKEHTINDKVAQKKVEETPASKSEIILTEKGNTLCFDSFSSRYFKSDIEAIRRAENNLNQRLLAYDYISLNDYFAEIGLRHTEIGYQLGWRVDKGLIKLHFSSQLADDGTPCVVVNFDNPPEYGFSSLV